MTENHRDLISIFFTLTIVLLAGIVTHEFFLPLTWAAIIAMASWPLYNRWYHFLGDRPILAASSITLLFILVIALPLLWLILILGKDIQLFTRFLIRANTEGATFPEWLDNIPWINAYLHDIWQKTLATPHSLSGWLTIGDTISLESLTTILKKVGSQIAHRSIAFGFSIMCLFFFYKDGYALINQIGALGDYCIGDRWQRYASTLPGAIKATVNGVVLIGMVVGVIMGVSYAIAGVPAPVLLGAITAVFAMIPFGVPIVFIIVSIILATQDHLLAAAVILAWGTLVMFVVDHFIRPFVIGGATKLPFLAVLFGILGGVKLFGIVGLFIGPVIMVLFITLWHEPELFTDGSTKG